ncbi:MAG: glycosyltransferase, partial [Planctomycetota bacterium]|nr:glycosyltransferase [Planctomycetota bacterium]
EEYAGREQRIRLTFRQAHKSIAAALNVALEAATGQYVALLGSDDELAEHALFAVAQAIAQAPDVDLLYTDQDRVDGRGCHREPFLKPDWSPEYLVSWPYTGRLSVCRTSLAREAGGLRGEHEALLDDDLVLRLMARHARIGHVPDVLYHTRADGGLDARAPPWAPSVWVVSDRCAIHRRDAETRRTAGVLDLRGANIVSDSASLRLRGELSGLAIAGRPKVSIIIPSRCQPPKGDTQGTPYVVRCVESIVRKSTWKEYEILVLDRNEMPAGMEARFKELGVRRVTYSEPFNWSRVNNLGVANATGGQFLFLNDDIEIITPDWLECLLEFSQQPEIAAVGAKLLFPDGRLQHAGVAIREGNPDHPYYGAAGDDPGYFLSNVVPRNYSAVTGACLMTRADVFRALGGFDERFHLNYNDVDYCLRAVSSGRRVVCTPYAQCYHHESVSKAGVFPEELARFRERWPQWCERDPFFNAHALEFAGR